MSVIGDTPYVILRREAPKNLVAVRSFACAQDDKREAHADRKEKHRRKKGAADAGASRKNTGQRALPRVFLIRRILQLMHERRSARNVGFFEDVHYMRLYRVAGNEELVRDVLV